tara:strand:+ start:36674 stop:37426 length:753 start_codon:yes stop_codon:yes gene_type:complete
MNIKRAMVLAAGKGKRLGELTRETPKPLVDLGGVTPLYRILKGLEHAGIEEIVINCHWRAEKIIAAIDEWKNCGAFNSKIIISYEETLLETGGGIKYALHNFNGEPFILVNGDIVWGEGFSDFVRELDAGYDVEKMDFLLAFTSVDHSRKDNGDFRFYADGRIDYLDKGELSEISYCGLSVVHPQIIKTLPDGFAPLNLAWLNASLQKRFYGYKNEYPWIDMGTPEGLQKARNVIKYENGLPAKVLKFGI